MEWIFKDDPITLGDKIEKAPYNMINLKTNGLLDDIFESVFEDLASGDITHTLENRLLSHPSLSKNDIVKIKELFASVPYEYNFEPITPIFEAQKDKFKDHVPVYFIFNGSTSLISKLIKFFSKGDYTHASISTEGLSEITSFGNTYRNNGFVTENYGEFIDWRKPKYISVIAIPVPLDVYKRIKSSIVFFKNTLNNYKYSTRKLLLFKFKVREFDPKQNMTDLICTEYVSYILNLANYNMNMKFWVTPSEMQDAVKKIPPGSHVIYEGLYDGFNETLVEDYKKAYYHSDVFKKKKDIDDEVKSEEEKKRDELKNTFIKF